MLTDRLPPVQDLPRYLEQAEAVILPTQLSEAASRAPTPPGRGLAPDRSRTLRVGVDLGTATLVLVVLDEDGLPLAGEWQPAGVVRDGLVVDFAGAVERLRGMKTRVEQRLGRELTHAASGYPPGVSLPDARAAANVVEAAGMDCSGLLDEPSAANLVLNLQDGAIVDVGGGTTGIAVVRDGQVVYTADEPTGGVHFSLVVAGSQGISYEEADALKLILAEQPRLLPLVRPVMEKVASIILRHVEGRSVGSITLVGGGSSFLGMAEVIEEYSGIPARVAAVPWLVTPLGLALHDVQ
jgi:ethanolamine utilization protein EutJ